MEGAIIPTTDLTNRTLKRRFVNEAKKIALPLEQINTAFIWELFNAPDHLSYADIYAVYSQKWTDQVKELSQRKEFTLAAIDILFFSREYKPRNNEKAN
jgi:hypothetical protein